ERPSGSGDMSAPGRVAARDRARGSPDDGPVAPDDPRSSGGPLRPADRWGPRRAGPPAEPARYHRLELRPPRYIRAGAVSAARRLPRRLEPGGRGGGGSRGSPLRSRPPRLARRQDSRPTGRGAGGRGALRDAGDDPGILPRATVGDDRRRRGALPTR